MGERSDRPTPTNQERIEQLVDENERLRRELERSERERDRLRRENERLRKELEAARRAGFRQAAPFSKGAPTRIPVDLGGNRDPATGDRGGGASRR